MFLHNAGQGIGLARTQNTELDVYTQRSNGQCRLSMLTEVSKESLTCVLITMVQESKSTYKEQFVCMCTCIHTKILWAYIFTGLCALCFLQYGSHPWMIHSPQIFRAICYIILFEIGQQMYTSNTVAPYFSVTMDGKTNMLGSTLVFIQPV